MHDLNEGWQGSWHQGDVGVGLSHGSQHVGGLATALAQGETERQTGQRVDVSWDWNNWSSGTLRSITHQLTLGLGAQGGLGALPVTLGLLAHWGTLGLRGDTRSVAHGWGTDGLTLGAGLLLAHILRTTNVALWLVTVHLALGTLSLLTLDLALGALAHWVALGGAHGVVTLPTALWVTFGTSLGGGNHAQKS